ncbi:MAG: hypothetical protein LBC64_08505 [Fibromonadaceae bacterium]|nr:hypothetical protein [Fibromonadaceae bacterium]
MSNLAQVDKIVKQAATLKADDKIILLYKIQDLLVAMPQKKENITMKSVFGLWKNRDINEKDLRKKAWKQK